MISNDTRTSTVNFGSFGSTAMRGIDTLSVIKGNVSFYETGVGAHYYACSSYSNTYSEAFANIKLPTSFNNAGNSRNGYIALGIGGSVHGVDLGLMNDGTGWFPCYYDVGVQFGSFPSYKAPSTATNAIITVTIVNTTTVRMYIQFLNSSGSSVGTAFNQNITVASNNFVSSGGSILCSFYRFASLVPKGVDNQMDGSYMLGGQTTNCQLWNGSSYVGWGIGTARVENAWRVSPERISFSYSSNNDIFGIDHWA